MSIISENSTVDINKRLEKRLIDREHEFTTYKKFYILIGTFNVNNQSAPNSSSIEEWLHREMKTVDSDYTVYKPDIVAVGFQEIDTSSGAYIYDDKRKEDDWEYCIRRTLQTVYKSHEANDKFQLINRVRLMGILLFVYVPTKHMTKCGSVSRASIPTGFMGVTGNKGGVGIRFRFYETDLCFINCHLAAGDSQMERRNLDYQTIESRMLFVEGSTSSMRDFVSYTSSVNQSKRGWKINEHDIIFWFGDMNYRINYNNERVRQAIKDNQLMSLHDKDQLMSEMKSYQVFRNYYEAFILFPPTYKFDSKSDVYDTSEKSRTPSWTDRILWRSKRTQIRSMNGTRSKVIESIDYCSAKNIRFSDHRPVSSLLSVMIKHSFDQMNFQRVREELIREIDREDNQSIPTVEFTPRVPAIICKNVRFLDRRIYSFKVKNTSDFPCSFSISPASQFANNSQRIPEDPFFDCLTLIPNSPYTLDIDEEQTLEISFQIKSQYIWLFGRQINEILVLHVDNGADTFITVDIELDMGPFGLVFDQYLPTFYDTKTKEYVQNPTTDTPIVPMTKEPPVLFINLIEYLKSRPDINFIEIFNNDFQDSVDLKSIRDAIYAGDYNFCKFSTIEIFLILLHLLRSLPEPLVSREIQNRIFLPTKTSSANSLKHPVGSSIQYYIPEDAEFSSVSLDRSQIMILTLENSKIKERNLLLRFLSLIQKSWPNNTTIRNLSGHQRNILSIAVDIISICILHDHTSQENRRAFLQTYLSEETKKTRK